MKVRANGLSLPDLDTLAALETGRYWTPAKRPGEALYRPAINNGYWAEDILTNGLVLYVPLWLYSGSKFPSVDAYKRTCSVTGATWGIQGRTFDGVTDKIAVVNIYQTRITLMAWVKSTDITQTYRGIAVQPYSTESKDPWHEYGLAVEAAQTPSMHIATGGVRSSASGSNALTTWTHLAGVYDGASITLYVNGVAGTPVLKTGDINNYGRVFTIGRFLTETSFKGLIGEVMLYKRALTTAEITHIYNATRWRYA